MPFFAATASVRVALGLALDLQLFCVLLGLYRRRDIFFLATTVLVLEGGRSEPEVQ